MPQFSLGGAAAPRRSSLFPHPTLDARMPGGPGRPPPHRIATLDAEMIATREAEAFGAQSREGTLVDHADSDRATWHRFLAAAMRLKAQYGPCMRWMRQETGQLDRLMTSPIAARSDVKACTCPPPAEPAPVPDPYRLDSPRLPCLDTVTHIRRERHAGHSGHGRPSISGRGRLGKTPGRMVVPRSGRGRRRP